MADELVGGWLEIVVRIGGWLIDWLVVGFFLQKLRCGGMSDHLGWVDWLVC